MNPCSRLGARRRGDCLVRTPKTVGVPPREGDTPLLTTGTELPSTTGLTTTIKPWQALLTTYLFIIKIRLKPVPHHGRGEGEAEVHEPDPADVGRVAVVEETQDLLLGEFECVELVEEAEG